MLRSTRLFALFLLVTNQLINQSISQSTPDSDCAIREVVYDYVDKIQSFSIGQSTDRSFDQSIDPSIDRSIDRAIDQSINQSIDQSTSWSSYAFDALRLGAQCKKNPPTNQSINRSINRPINAWDDYVGLFPAADTVPKDRRQSINQSISQSRTQAVQCDMEIFVDNQSTNQSTDQSIKGSIDAPVSTIQEALQMIRASRDQSINQSINQYPPACITIREGVYYLAANQSINQPINSRHGAIALTPRDSNLTIRAYSTNQSINQSTNQYEKVVLSGGLLIDAKWQQIGNGIYRTTLKSTKQPINVQWAAFNELYVGINQSTKRSTNAPINQSINRGIRAKSPNGDPSTHGLHTSTTGWYNSAQKWLSPHEPTNPPINVNIQSPQRPNSTFPNFQLGVSGTAEVFNPPINFWSSTNPPEGGTYMVPGGMQINLTQTPIYVKSQSIDQSINQPQTGENGFVHAFHDGHWGSWIFDIASIDQSGDVGTVNFGAGGFQEARGSRSGGQWYIDHRIEELDDFNEWYVDAANQLLFFKPNTTQSINDMSFIVSQLPCLISVVGSTDELVSNVRFEGLIFTETSNTFMSDYRVPSGGDWAIHTGGTVYLSNTQSINLSANRFTQLGSNAISLFGYNADTLIDSNDFSWLGDSGVVLCGVVDGIDGISSTDQPINTIVASNHFRETGIYVKQSSPIIQFLSRAPTYIGNAMYNMPRAGINVNDGFAGDMLMHGNVIFNAVRETSDHGPFNSWDRQPYLTLQPASNGQLQPTLIPALNRISGNLLFNSYSSVWPIDHDDGSCFYEDSYNLMIYGGYKTYLGHSKSVHDNFYFYPDSPRFDTMAQQLTNQPINQLVEKSIGMDIPWGKTCAESPSPQLYVSGWGNEWFNNECHLSQSGLLYSLDGCHIGGQYLVPSTYNNSIYVPASQKPYIPCNQDGKVVNLSYDDWVAAGHDKDSTWSADQPVDQILAKVRALMQLSSKNKIKPSINQQVDEKINKLKTNRHRTGHRHVKQN